MTLQPMTQQEIAAEDAKWAAEDREKCAGCGHRRDRHDRSDRRRREGGGWRYSMTGCSFKWPRAGAVCGPANPCQCEEFISEK